MSDDIAIKVDSVSKTFRLPHEKNNSIKSAVINFYRSNRTYEKQEALRDVSFEVKKGEFFGIVGRNGSGKSTLLKMLAGIYSPSKGYITVNGKLTPFIELGVGFNPELTGRENVYLNGALLGFSRKEMKRMYRDIVDFAEIRKFMDQKLKNYSSGMQVRLAFSIAIRAKTSILVLDEVLAVGDAAFQKKCNKVFADMKKDNRTIVLVTHDMQSVRKFCDRAAVIDMGKLQGIYTPSEAAAVYQEINADQQANENTGTRTLRRWGDGKVKIKSVEIFSNGKKIPENRVKQGDDLEIKFVLESKKKLPVTAGLMFEDSEGVNVSGPNSQAHTFSSDDKIIYRINKLPLSDGDYKITAAIFNDDLTTEHDHIYNGFNLIVMPNDNPDNSAGKINLFGDWSKKGN